MFAGVQPHEQGRVGCEAWGAEALLSHSCPSAARLQRRKSQLRDRAESPGCPLAPVGKGGGNACVPRAGTFHPPHPAQSVEGVARRASCAQDAGGAGVRPRTPRCSGRWRPSPGFASIPTASAVSGASFPHTKRGPSGVGAGHRVDQPCFSTGVIPSGSRPQQAECSAWPPTPYGAGWGSLAAADTPAPSVGASPAHSVFLASLPSWRDPASWTVYVEVYTVMQQPRLGEPLPFPAHGSPGQRMPSGVPMTKGRNWVPSNNGNLLSQFWSRR